MKACRFGVERMKHFLSAFVFTIMHEARSLAEKDRRREEESI